MAPEILEQTNHRRYTRAVDIWSLGVVLYICLCGFPPFSDELYTHANPYTLAQQIKMGRFDYPSPYWDPVSDIALDLIDRMLTVNVDRRISIADCLEHPWTTRDPAYFPPASASASASPSPAPAPTTANPSVFASASAVPAPAPSSFHTDSGLTSIFNSLDFARRKPQRERTLLADLNDVRVAQVIPIASSAQKDHLPLKLWEKNKSGAARKVKDDVEREADGILEGNGGGAAAAQRGNDDAQAEKQPLFADGGDSGSVYQDRTMRAPDEKQ